MSRIVIHIGTHKTATTHVQDVFNKNRALLKQHGVIIPYIGRTRGQHGLASAWIKLPFPYGLLNPLRAWQKLARAHATRGHTVFVSSEELSRLRPGRVDMAQLHDLVSDFDEVLILCTLRNQANFLQSVYQQISVERNPGPWRPFLVRALDSLMVDGLTLDYCTLYNHILSGFAPENIHFLSYEAAVVGEGGIIGAFLRVLGVPLTAEQLVPFSTRNSNVSDDPLATLAANLVAQPQLVAPGLVAIMRDSLDKTLPRSPAGGRARTTLFSQPEIRELTTCFGPLNAKLSRRLAPWQPDFQVAPMLGKPGPGPQGKVGQGNLGLAFRGQLTEDFWVQVCRSLRSSRGFPA